MDSQITTTIIVFTSVNAVKINSAYLVMIASNDM